MVVATTTLEVRVAGETYRLRALSDRMQYADADGRAGAAGVPPSSWPLFGVLWPVSVALAEEIAKLSVAGKRVLEMGCGLALPSLVLKRRGADVTAMDYNPIAGDFLASNTEANGLPPIPFRCGSWIDADLGRFDLLVGADVLYEPDHAEQVPAFIARHAAPGAEVLIADPGRRQLGAFSKRMAALGFQKSQLRSEPKVRILSYRRAG